MLSKYFLHLALLLFVIACGSKQDKNESKETTNILPTPEPKDSTSDGDIVLMLGQMEFSGVELANPEERAMASAIKANGTTVALPSNRATVTSKINGRIEKFLVHEGQNVRKGQPICVLSVQGIIDIQHAYLQAKTDLTFLEKELARQKAMQAENVGAAKNLQEIQARYYRVKADLSVAKAKLESLGMNANKLQDPNNVTITDKLTITAPISGNITEIMTNIGSPITDNTEICKIVNLDDMHAHLQIFQKDLSFVRQGQAVIVSFNDASMPDIHSKIEYISHEVNPETKTVSLHVPLPKGKNNVIIYPEMHVSALIQTNTTQLLAVPESAVIKDDQNTYLFYVKKQDGNKYYFGQHIFTPNGQSDGYVAIPDLPKEAKVVVKGANILNGEYKRAEMTGE